MICIRGPIQQGYKRVPQLLTTSRDWLLTDRAVVSIESIINEICTRYKISRIDLLSRRRARHLAWPRQEAYWRASKETMMSLPAIGRAFGRDHTTIMHGIDAHEKRSGHGET